MFEIQTAQSLLRLDPELGQLLTPERRAEAERTLTVPVASIRPGPWRPDALCRKDRASNVGLLVVEGASLREVRLLDAPSAELFGTGDIIRTWDAEPAPETLTAAIDWHALEPVKVAVMDGSTALALRHYPEVMSVVLDRLHARSERFAVTQAISQITGVDTRIEAVLRHISQRWGRVGTHGVTVSLALSHRMLGSLVGARRPTVSSALATLAAENRVLRRADGLWLLPGSNPLAHVTEADRRSPTVVTARLESMLVA
jgi:CRP/FNR family cyclic AMP-dependent transcriptional regulator